MSITEWSRSRTFHGECIGTAPCTALILSRNRRLPLLTDLLEEPQVRRRLVLFDRHQIAVGADGIEHLANRNQLAGVLAVVRLPPWLRVVRIANVPLVNRPG